MTPLRHVARGWAWCGGCMRTDLRMKTWHRTVLGLIPVVLIILFYLYASDQLQETDKAKLLPTPAKLWDALKRVAWTPDRDGQVRLWVDTWASTQRFGIAVAIIACSVVIGLYMGCFPLVAALLYPVTIAWGKIPAMSILPIAFMVFAALKLEHGLETSLIVIGVAPAIILDAYLRIKDIPREQFYKAQSLGATEQEIAWRIILPQLLPSMLNTIRLSFGAMVLLLIAAETLGAKEGLGYRIFIVRRFVAMDIIIVYVVWITAMLWTADFMLTLAIKKLFRWTELKA